jgi:hypothetical protein
MGRSMLIIVTSLFLVFSLTQIGVRNRQTQIDQLSISYAHLSQARNAANAGLERALRDLGLNDSLRATSPLTYAFGNHSASVWILDNRHDVKIPLNHVELRSTGKSGADDARVVAQIYQVRGLPYVSGAMSIYGGNIDIQKFNSNAFEISGVDRDGIEQPLPGMTSNTTSGYNSIMSGLPPNSYDNIKGKGGTPSVAVDTYMDPAALIEFIEEAKAKRNYTCVTGNKQCEKDAGTNHPGTVADPKIMVIQSGGIYDLKQGVGAGIIIVESGGELDLTGSPEYHGLIIMMGTLKMLNGTPKIFGGMIFAGSNPVLDVDATVTVPVNGNANIQYSSKALENVEKKLSVSTATRQYVTYILD